MFVPSMLLQQLYTNASLRNTPAGVTFSLKNRLSDAVVTAVDRVAFDGVDVPADRVTIDTGDEPHRSPATISTATPLVFPLRKIVDLHCAVPAPPDGKHTVQPASWAFLAVFPLLALALERRSHWLAAGAASLTLGGWVTLTAMELWQGAWAVPAVFALAVGAAIDAWAHRPDRRRPAFARATPGLVFMIGGFALMTAGALGRSSPGAWFAHASTTTPALVLLGALVAISVWPTTARGAEAGSDGAIAPPYRRPQAVGAIVAIWLALWFVLPPQGGPAPEWWAWLWLIVSSAGLVGLTISAVAESAETDERGVLFAGITSMLILILVHITAAGPGRFGRSSLVLFVSAAALWWTTSRHKAASAASKL